MGTAKNHELDNHFKSIDMRKLIAAGNWKMNLTATDASALVGSVLDSFAGNNREDVHVLFSPSYPFLSQVVELAASHDRVHVAAQNIHQEEKGAYTGEVSASQLVSIGVTHVLIGHSERRQYFGESTDRIFRILLPSFEHRQLRRDRASGNESRGGRHAVHDPRPPPAHDEG